jgi:hypothetical protein
MAFIPHVIGEIDLHYTPNTGQQIDESKTTSAPTGHQNASSRRMLLSHKVRGYKATTLRSRLRGETAMNAQLWLGIGIGAVLSLLASIAANLLNQRIQRGLERFKFTRTSKRRSKALKEFILMNYLQSGVIDKYVYLMRYAYSAQSQHGQATVLFLFAFLAYALVILPPDRLPHIASFGLLPPPPSREMTKGNQAG